MVSFLRVLDEKSLNTSHLTKNQLILREKTLASAPCGFVCLFLIEKHLLDIYPSHHFFFFRIHQPAIKIRHLEPWKIALIVIGTAVAAAITIGLLVYFLAYGKLYRTYHSSVTLLSASLLCYLRPTVLGVRFP